MAFYLSERAPKITDETKRSGDDDCIKINAKFYPTRVAIANY